MQTQIKQINEVEYELEIEATAEDLKADFDKALRAQRARTELRGFRPGKVPLSLVKKLYGQAIGEAIGLERVQQVYETEVLESGTYRVLGQPTVTRLDYTPDGDLRAAVRFGVRPAFELKDLKGEQVPRLVHEVSDEEVEKALENLRKKEADLVPVDEPAGPEDYVIADVQGIDEATGMPLIGSKDEDVEFFLGDEDLRPEIRQALLGKKAGDTVQVHLPHDHDHDQVRTADHTHTFRLSVKEVKRRDLPELDEAFVRSVTGDRLDNPDDLRAEIREELNRLWAEKSREFLEELMIERIVDLHPLPVPESVIEVLQEAFVDELREMLGGKIPEGFDVARYREDQREAAIRQARWMFIRDKLIEEDGLQVTEEDRMARYEAIAAGGNFTAEDVRNYYRAQRALMEQLDRQLLDRKVYDALVARFDIVDLDREAYEAELKARSEPETVAAGQPEAGTEPPAAGQG
ncbi:MAG: trigger factor [Rhodothermaceae bacterium]|nr:MAG: trigger factor [Rhodothermaceae bacterium]